MRFKTIVQTLGKGERCCRPLSGKLMQLQFKNHLRKYRIWIWTAGFQDHFRATSLQLVDCITRTLL